MYRIAAASFLALLLQACSKAPESPAVTPVIPIRAAPASIAWVKPEGVNIEAIFTQAQAAKKPVFLYWGAVWCPPCNQIKATVFNRQDFIERSKLFVPVYLDGDTPGAQKLGARFKVRGYPTMILFKPDGTELTRLPGEVDADTYMEVLGLALNTSSSVKESLATALSTGSAALTPDAWRQLAFYAWDQDEAQLVTPRERTATLHLLAKACPAAVSDAASRLALKAMVASAMEKTAPPETSASLVRVHQILGDARSTRENFDVLISNGEPLVLALTQPGSANRTALLSAWRLALDRLSADTTLSQADRLSAVGGKLGLAGVGQPQGVKPTLDAKLMNQVREAVAMADQTTTNTYERQAVIPGAAQLLSEAGLMDESDALLQAELPKAVSAYYHMLVLSSNAKARGDTRASLDWAEKAWGASTGPATRLQWGSSYVNRLIELAPQDAKRIEKAASGVLSELAATPETFYERNRRGLERMGQRLMVWSTKGQHHALIKKLQTQLNTVCSKLPPQDEAHAACTSVFKT
jgi:hypothetical protein